MPIAVVSKRLQSIIERHVSQAPAPYDFYIEAPSAGGRTAVENTSSAYTQLKVWAERMGAEVKLKHDTFAGGKTGHLVVEITDPAAQLLEALILRGQGEEEQRQEESRQQQAIFSRFEGSASL